MEPDGCEAPWSTADADADLENRAAWLAAPPPAATDDDQNSATSGIATTKPCMALSCLRNWSR